MSAIGALAEKAERSDFAAVEEGFLGFVSAGTFPEGCGAETKRLAELLVQLGRRNLAVTLVGMAWPEMPAAEAIPVLETLIRLAPTTPGLATELVERVQTVHGSDATIRAALRASQLGSGGDVVRSLDRFQAFSRVRVGQYVRHRGDWGVGCIREIDPLTAGVVVDFQRRPNHSMTVEGVVDLLDFLEADSWPARKFDRMDEIRRLADEEPGTLVLQLTDYFGGKTDLPTLRGELKGSVIPADKWTRWWSSAKKAAQRDPHLEVRSVGSSTVFEKRSEAVTPADEIRAAISLKKDLAGRWEVARTALRTFAGTSDLHVLRDPLIEAVRNAPAGEAETQALIEALLFLETAGWSEATTRLAPIAACATRETLERLPSKDEQRRFAELIAANAPEGGTPELFAALFLDGIKVRDEIRRMLPAELREEVEGRLLGDPAANLEAFVDVLTGQWTVQSAPESEVVRAAARFGHDVSRRRDLNKTTLERYIKRCREYLLAKECGRVRRYIEERSKDEVSRLASYLRRTDSLADIYHNHLRLEFERKLPEEVRKVVRRFWESEYLYSTQEGIERRRKDFRHLMQVEIPDNERAIGEAAARGDLSENAEWTAAIEKQKELTEKAQHMREEFERARPLEEEEISSDYVSPGTRVFLKEPATGEEKVYEVLGPWDVDVEHGVLSYLSPIAAGLLGKRVGEEAAIELPGQTFRYEVVAIEHFLQHSSMPAGPAAETTSSTEPA